MTGKVTGVFAMMGLVAMVGAASAAPMLLGQPCRAKNVLASLVTQDPNAPEKHWLVLSNMNESSGMELLFVDYKANTGHAVRAPAGAGAWALKEVSGHRLVVGTYYDGTFMVYDLKARAWIRSVKFPGEDYIWNLALGKDGRIYGGTYPGGKLGALNLETYELEDCGAPAKPNMYLRYVSPTPDGRIFCQFGMDRNRTKIYDPDTKQWSDAPDYLQDVTQATLWNGYFLFAGRAYEGKDLKPVKTPPFPLPKGATAWTVNIPLTTEDTLYFYVGPSLYRYRKGDAAPTFITRRSLRGGGFAAATPEGDVLARRGQDYALMRPNDPEIALRPYPVESAPRPTHFLALDPKGRLWGGPTFGQTVFWLDTKTGKYENTGTVTNHGGEVYDAVFRDNAAFFTSYVGGDIVRYDTDAPWDQFNGVNPRTIHKISPDYIRPVGGIVWGPDGKLYSGWMAEYGKYGGALAISDPEGGPGELLRDPLGAVAVGGVDVMEGHIFLGSSLAANGLRNKPDTSPEFAVMDRKTREILYRRAFPGAAAVRLIRADRETGRVAFVAGAQPALFDIATMEMVDLPAEPPATTANTAAAPGDGFYYYADGDTVMALNMRTGRALPAAKAPKPIEYLAASRDGALYAACGVDIYRLRAPKG